MDYVAAIGCLVAGYAFLKASSMIVSEHMDGADDREAQIRALFSFWEPTDKTGTARLALYAGLLSIGCMLCLIGGVLLVFGR